MELLSVGIARSIWLFDPSELNPGGKSIFPEILLWAAEKYSFQIYPKTISEVDEKTKAYVFKTGDFQDEDGSFSINFSFYNDGVVGESWASTAVTDGFLEDLLRSASQKFGLAYRPDMIRSKRYVSELNVRFDSGLNSINPRMARFSKMLSGFFAAHHLPTFELSGMIFGVDSSAHSYKPSGFMVERKQGVPFSENRFWSQSPFATSDHLQALSEFEKLLAGR